MSKKVLSLVLALVMVLGSFSFVSAAAYDDVTGTEYADAVDRLSLLGVLEGYPDGSFKPEGNITRAEFAAVAVRVKGLANAAEAATGLPTGFTDVPTWNWASGIVGTAAKAGIVNGVGHGLFAPQAPVKYEEAITMLVRALGYEVAAQAKGGYPYGYLIVANEIGVLDEVKGTQGVPASRGIVAQMTDNALEIEMMIQVGYGEDTKWVVSGSKEHGDEAEPTYLLDEMGFEKFEGRVQFDDDFDDEITLIDEEERNSKVTLDVAEGFDFYEVEGATITVWYDGDDAVLSYTVEDEILFDAVEYEADDEITLVGENSDYDLADDVEIYLDNEEVKEKDYDKNFEADYAKVVLNDDGDVAFVDAYNFDGFIIANEVEDEEILDVNEDELDTDDFLLVKEGKTIAVGDVEEGDVVFFDDSQEFAVVYNNSVVGEVDRVYTNKDSFRLDGETYDYVLDALYLDEDKLDELTDETLEGMVDEESEVEVFFNFEGDVVLVVGATGLVTKDDYAVLTDDVLIFNGRKGDMLGFDLLNAAGEKVSYDIEIADLIYNGKKVEIENNLKITKNDNGEYKFDGGEIVTIGEALIDQEQRQLFEISTDKDGDVEEINLYVGVLKEFGNVVNTSEGFEIDDKYVTDEDDDDYRLQSSTVVFYDWDGGEYDEVVALGEAEDVFSEVDKGYVYEVKGEAEVVLAVETDADTDTTDYTGLVTDAYVTRDDEIEFTIEVLGKEMEFTTDEDYKLSNIAGMSISKEDDVVKLENRIVTLSVSDKTELVEDVTVEAGTELNSFTVNTANRTITSGNNTYELVRNAVIYKPNSDSDISLRDLRDDYTTATVYAEENSPRFIEYVVAGTANAGGGDVATDGTVTYITSERGNFYLDINGDDPVQLTGNAKIVFMAFNNFDQVGSANYTSNPFYDAELATVVEDGKITGFEYIKFADDVTLNTNMGAAFDGITIEGAKANKGVDLNGTFTVNADDVTLKNLTLTGTVTVAAGVEDFTAIDVAGNILNLNGGGTNSVVLEGSAFTTVNVKAKVRVVLNKSTATNVTVANTGAGSAVEVTGAGAAIDTLTANGAVSVEGGDKVDDVVANVAGVEFDKAPTGTISGSKEISVDGETTDQNDLFVAEAEKALAAYEAKVDALEAAVAGKAGAWTDAKEEANEAKAEAKAAILKTTEAADGGELVADNEDLKATTHPLTAEYYELVDAQNDAEALRTSFLDYNDKVAEVPANNDEETYTEASWTEFETAIGECDLTLDETDGKAALDAEVIKIQDALSKLVEADA